MVGPFKRSKDKKTHLLVAADKFTKWVEAEPVSKCDAATAVQFMKKVIFCLVFYTSLSLTMALICPKGLWRSFVKMSIFGLMFHQWRTLNPMVKLIEPIRKS